MSNDLELTPAQADRANEYARVIRASGLTQERVAAGLSIGEECVSRRVNYRQVVTVEALRALKHFVAEVRRKPREDWL